MIKNQIHHKKNENIEIKTVKKENTNDCQDKTTINLKEKIKLK